MRGKHCYLYANKSCNAGTPEQAKQQMTTIPFLGLNFSIEQTVGSFQPDKYKRAQRFTLREQNSN